MDTTSEDLADHLSSQFAGVLSVVANDHRPLFPIIFPLGEARVLRMKCESVDQAKTMIKHLSFCCLRYELWKRAKFSFRGIASAIPDSQPLRFFIPFKFCEPFKASNGVASKSPWYRFAPFEIVMESHAQPQHCVYIYAEINEMEHMPCDPNTRAPQKYCNAQVIFSEPSAARVRFNVRLRNPWRREA